MINQACRENRGTTGILPGTIATLAMWASFAGPALSDITYPYVLPAQLNATLKVDTGSKTGFKNMLLGLNTNFPENQYGSDGYNDADGQALITAWNPPSLRFPHGVWANFYDWEVDGRRIYDGYTGTYYNAVVNVPNLKYGYDGFKTLHDSLDFDVLFTWNVNYDSPAKGVARLQDRVADGFDVKYIELGNEHFWLSQCSEATDTPAEYVAVAQAHSAALKAEDPSIQISVPVSWRDTGYHVSYNNALMADMSYFDAVSLHKYLRTDGNTATDVQDALKSRAYMIETGDYIRSLFPGKPIWLSEWSVKVDVDGQNAASVLGMTEVYLGMLNRPDLFETADYFQIHNHDPMVIYDKNGTPKHTKTSIGAAYDIIRDVFEDSEVYASSVNSSSIEEVLDAVSAEAVTKGGDTIVFAINKSPNSVPLDLKFDDALYTGTFTHEALAFSDINDFPSFNLGDDALDAVSPVNGGIMLPPLSISKISGLTPGASSAVAGELIMEAESADGQASFAPYTVESEVDGPTYIVTANGTPTANFNAVSEPDGIAAYEFNLSQAGDVLIEARVDFADSDNDSFWHRVDGGSWIKQDNFSGGGWRWFTLQDLTGLSAGSHTLEIARRDGSKIDQFRLSATGASVFTETMAHAGGNQSVPDSDADGIEMVNLDGSSSTPGSGLSITSHVWKRGSRQIATGISPSITLPLGTHLITLQVTDSDGTTKSDTATIVIDPAISGSGTTSILAGWDTWNSATTPSASVLAPNASGTAVTTTEGQNWNTSDERGASADGDWGSFAGPPAADTTVGTANDQNLELPNATTGGTITFTITNTGTSDVELDAFHFDAYAFRPKAARAYQLSVPAGGGITPGVIYTSTDDEITSVGGTDDNLAHDDIDHSLAGLADHTLGAGESADLLLAFSSGVGDGAGGHDLWVDNVAISSISYDPYPDNDGNGLPDWWEDYYLGSTGQVTTADSDGDGFTNGEELIAGTDPGDSGSPAIVHDFNQAAGDYTVTWDSHSGRSYEVMKAVDLAADDWISISGPLPGTGGEMSFTDPVPVSTPYGFYRIKITGP